MLVGFVCVRTHWMDLGAKDPGYVLDSTDVHQEGMLFPGTKVFDRGVLDRQIVELIRFNSRMPEVVIGDLHAQVATLRTGERRLLDIVAKFGRDAVDAAIDDFVAHAERVTRDGRGGDAAPGRGAAVDWLDDDGITTDPIRMQVTVTIGDGRFVVDFAGSAPATARPGEHALRLDDRLGAGGVQVAHQPVRRRTTTATWRRSRCGPNRARCSTPCTRRRRSRSGRATSPSS